MPRQRAIVLAIILLFPPTMTRSLEPETAKVGTDDAWAVDFRRLEVHLGYYFARARRGFDDRGSVIERAETRLHVPNLLLTYGVRPGVDLGLGTLWVDVLDRQVSVNRGQGFGDMVIAAKWTFLDRGTRALAWTTALTAPVGEEPSPEELGPGEGYWSLAGAIVASANRGRFAFTGDLGYRLPFGGERREQRGFFTVNGAAGWQWTPWLQPELELNFGHDFIHRLPDARLLATTAGVIVNVGGSLRFDAGMSWGVVGRNADRLVGAVLNVAVTL